jgi:hypothetical protein
VHRPERREPRVGGPKTFRDVLVGQPIDVKSQLLVELLFNAVATKSDRTRRGTV